MTARKNCSGQDGLPPVPGDFQGGLLLNEGSDAVLVIDNESRLLNANPVVCALSGYPLASIAGLGLNDIFSPLKDSLQTLTRTRPGWVTQPAWVERGLIKQDGQVIPVSLKLLARPEGG
jgi:PAS domain S-box-containing protein